MLYRKITAVIESHLKSESKKVLLIDGTRQVGKTYIVKYVGKKLFQNFIEINMIKDDSTDQLFNNVKSTEDFYLQISLIAGDKLQERENALIFIDEIQACPHL